MSEAMRWGYMFMSVDYSCLAAALDPAVAKRVMDLRYPDRPSTPAPVADYSPISDENWVASQLRLAERGVTHDEELVRLLRFVVSEG